MQAHPWIKKDKILISGAFTSNKQVTQFIEPQATKDILLENSSVR